MRRSQTALLRVRSLAVAGLFVVSSVALAPTAAAGSASDRASGGSAPAAPAASRSGIVDRTVRMRGAPGRITAGNRPARRVVVKDLPRPTGHERVYQSKLRTPSFGAGAAGTGGSTKAPATQAKPPSVLAVASASVTTTNPATEEVSAAGTSMAVSSLEPPDPFVAVGPDHVVQATNAGIRITSRTLGAPLATQTLSAFFGIDAIGNGYQAQTFDPRVIYDSLHNRWIATEASFDCLTDASTTVGTGFIDVAISDTADPTLGWSILSLPYTDTAPDYPGLGTSTDKVVASANVFALQPSADPNGIGCDIDGTTFYGTELDVMGWSQLLGTGDVTVTFLTSYINPIDFANSFFTLRPSVQAPAANPDVFGVGIRVTNSAVAWFKVTGLPASKNVALNLVSPATREFRDVPGIDPFDPSVPASAQPGGTIAKAVDGRPTDAIWQNNRLLFVSTLSCDPPGGGAEDRDCVRVSEIGVSSSTTNPPVSQDMVISETGRDLYMGGVGLTQNGDLHVVWTASSATASDFPSTYTAYQPIGATINSLTGKQKIASGTASYGGIRWGDYVGLAQDPRVPDAVWQADEYSTGATWSTRVSQLRTFGGASYEPITPLRVLDSRGSTGGAGGPFAANSPKTVQITGVGSIPSNAIGVTGNVTIVGQQAAGYVAVTPTAVANPTSSTINFPTGDTRANNFTLPLSATGKLAAVYKAPAGKTTHVVIDITGYFTAGSANGTYTTVTPTRILDSRGAVGLSGKFVAGTGRPLQVTGAAGVPSGAIAITGNLTIVNQQAAGYLSVTPDVPVGTPPSSSLNFPVGDVRANGLTAALNGSGQLAITYTAPAGKTTDVVLDVTGYYTTGPGGLLFYPLSPGRLLDSRSNVLTAYSGKFVGSTPHPIPTSGHQGVAAGAQAMTGNLTVVNQTRAGYAADTPTPTATPTTSTINFPVGDIRANGVTVPLDSGSQALVYIGGSGTTDLILDVTGYFK